MMSYHWFDFVGNIGVACVLFAYFGVQSGRLPAHDLRFSLVNGVGALLIMVSLFYNFNLSSFIIECVWLAISVYGVMKHVLR
ncbi:MAG: hypothetical protein KDI19_03565 [Pseudomonadales bacterium]|nr:hypothetical protein [Pseudomonadales bacterium]